jgi:imipenem/basic amino acid-specific outer membrane pore
MIALAVSAGTSQFAIASAQDDSKGFVKDSTFNINTRALYFSKDNRNNSKDDQSRSEETGLGFNGLYKSGFTQGTIGVGVDVIGLLGVKLDSGKDRIGTGLFPTNSEKRSQDDYSKGGGAVKFRISDTVLKIGDQYTTAPVFGSDDSRLLPELPRGISITSNELKGLKLEGGHFTSSVAQNKTYHDSLHLKKTDFIGGVYSFTPKFTGSLYYAKTEDYFRKYYSNLNWTQTLSDDQSFALDFNIYDTKGQGAGLQDPEELDNRALSLQGAYTVGAHTFTLAAQKVTGHGGYGYGADGGGSIFLANSVTSSDFNAEGEKSLQARYDINMATFGVPGLSFMTRYVSGSGANTGNTSNGREWERDIEGKYVIQSGSAKDLSLHIRQATYRSSDGVNHNSASIDELRLIAEYPLNIL